MPLEGRCPTTGKIRYTRAEARARAKAARRKTGHRMSEFHCRGCKWWHYGHNPGSS